MMTFGEMIFWHASRQPDKPAVIVPKGIFTYGNLRDAIGCCASRVQGLGWAPGGTVAILANNPLRFLIVAAALGRLGFVTMSVTDWQNVEESSLPLAGVISGQPAPANNRVPFAQFDDAWFSTAPVDKLPPLAVMNPHAVHHIALSSGSTGRPQPFGFDADAIREIQITMAVIGNAFAWDRLLCIPGPGIYFGYAVATMALVSGKTLVFGGSPFEYLNLVALYGVEWIVASNVQLEGLIRQQITQPIALPLLRMVYFGGSLVTRALIQAARTNLPAQIVAGYGSTESGVVALCPGERMPRRDGATGYVAPWVTLEVVDEEGRVLPSGSEGVIRLRTPAQGRPFNPSSGSFEKLDPESGWLYPGDMGLVQPDGLLVITGRTKEIINAGGVKFAPEILEQALLTHPDVAEAAAVMMPDARGIEELWVAVVTRNTVDSESLRRQCQERFRRVYFHHFTILDAIPRTELGKTAREELRKILRATRDSERATQA
jgi:acyl-coenzyme A synthetase/AMP-(fatty) acid ligase